MAFGTARGRRSPAAWLGAAVLVALAGTDAVSATTVTIPLFVLGPLVAALDATPRGTAWLGAVATVSAVAFGWVNQIDGTARHAVAIAVNAVGGLFAWQLARLRTVSDRQLLVARPALDRAARLTAAMHAGKVGEWAWDARDDIVRWDDQTASLFGADSANAVTDVDQWLNRIDERDRPMVLAALAEGMERRRTFRFDHRCVWPDGSIHWLEGIGEPIVDEDGQATGAVGLVLDVDARHRELGERTRLLAIERAARLRAEYLARVHSVLATSLDVDEIIRRVTDAAVPDLADWCAGFVTIDRPLDQPTIVAAHADESLRDWAAEFRRLHPFDPAATYGAAAVIRNGRTEVLSGLSRGPVVNSELRDARDRTDVDCVVTVPMIGQLGVLGALQMVRSSERPTFDSDELELIEELAGRCGAALNTAALFARQEAGRAALDTLQRVSGGLARAATRLEVADAVIEHGLRGFRAAGAAVFSGDSDQLHAVRIAGNASLVPVEDLTAFAARTASNTVAVQHDGDHRTLVATGLQVMGHDTGALVFTFAGRRHVGSEEISLLLTLGARCAGALERASLYEGERETALVLQRRLLPALNSVPDWLEAAARYEPAAGRQIGGDWYQLIDAGPHQRVAVVGDAVGHGISSAAAMGQLRAAIATAIAGTFDTAAALEIVDRFAAQGPDTLGASAAIALLHENGDCDYLSAGHPPSLLVRTGGDSEWLEDGRRPLLGLGASAGPAPKVSSFRLGPGDLLLMYSDGLVERRGELLDDGLERLRALVVDHAHLDVDDLCETVLGEMNCSESDDDVAVFVMRRVCGRAVPGKE